MNNDPTFARLRSQRWRSPPPDFLERSLAAALSERVRAAKRRPVWAFIPKALRLPLAACWMLAAWFHLCMPEPVPQTTMERSAQMSPVTPADLVAHHKALERIAEELARLRQTPAPPL